MSSTMRQTRSYAPTYLDLDDTSARFLASIEGEEVIKSFLADCVQNHLPADFDTEAEIDEVTKDIGTIFGNFAHDYKGETAEVYLIIKNITDRSMWSSGTTPDSLQTWQHVR